MHEKLTINERMIDGRPANVTKRLAKFSATRLRRTSVLVRFRFSDEAIYHPFVNVARLFIE